MDNFEHYQKQASSKTMTPKQKIDRYANQDETLIFPDMISKLNNLNIENINVCDIGCGCSKPIFDLIEHSKTKKQNLYLIDGEQMLSQLPDNSHIQKIAGRYPRNIQREIPAKMDVIVTYSVLHYVILDGYSIIDFIDNAVEMLNDGGEFLIGDLPNYSKKRRFMNSDFGKEFHKKFANTTDVPNHKYAELKKGIIDDSMIMFILDRYRNMGFETYLLPQRSGLPFNYTREDILIKRSH